MYIYSADAQKKKEKIHYNVTWWYTKYPHAADFILNFLI